MSYSYSNIGKGNNLGSGLADKFLFAPIDRFKKIKAPRGTSALGDSVIIQDPHSFKTNEGFIEVITAPFVNNIVVSSVGDPGALKGEQKLSVMVPGSYAQQHEFIKNLANTPCVVLIPEGNCSAGFYYQLGSECSYCYVTAYEFNSGTTKDGRKGYNISFSFYSDTIFLYTATAYLKGVDYGSGLLWGGSNPFQWGIGNDLIYKTT